eukprot:1372311-Pyramimonas_sp.AAC.1
MLYPLTLGVFNPLRANTDDRVEEIGQACGGMGGLALVGTQLKATHGTFVRQRILPLRSGRRVLLEAGYSPSPYVTSAAGCSILWGRRVRPSDIVRVTPAPEGLRGRGLVSRAKNRYLDVTIVAAYFPPRPREIASRP